MPSHTFRNPILPGFNPDPSICHVPGQGYFVSTSTFEFFPGLPIYHSVDLISWKLIGHAINRRSQGVDMRTVESSAGLWAPTFRYHEGRWYMICSCFWRLRMAATGPEVISSGFYVSTDDIFDDSKWSEAVYFEEVGFDQDLLFDDDGKVYQTVTRFDFAAPLVHGNPLIQSFINEIDLATGRSLTEPVLAKASDLGVAEGCHIIKHDGWYYFFTAEGGTQGGHRECVYRSRKPTGPFEAPPDGVNPVVYNGDHPDIQNTGHMDLIQGDDGRWIAVFLGVRPVFEAKTVDGTMGMPTHLGRESFMAPVDWVDGWPVVNKKKAIELIGEADRLDYLPEPSEWRDSFDTSTLDLGWYNVRTPLRPCHSLSERPGHLALRGGPHDIAVEHSPTILLRKQTLFDLNWSTEMSFDPKREGEEAGSLVWLSATMYAALGVSRGAGGSLELVWRRPSASELGKIERSVLPLPLDPGEPITLHIDARKDSYDFAYSTQRGRTDIGTVSTACFVPLFTGVHLGLYAQGANETPCRQSAFFKYAKWVKA